MSYTNTELPYSGSVPLTRHTSRAGAEAAADRAPTQLVRYIAALMDAPDGLTDLETSKLLDIPLASVCARRSSLRKAGLIFAEGVRPGPTGISNAVWRWRHK